jgi:hypothetical protein
LPCIEAGWCITLDFSLAIATNEVHAHGNPDVTDSCGTEPLISSLEMTHTGNAVSTWPERFHGPPCRRTGTGERLPGFWEEIQSIGFE